MLPLWNFFKMHSGNELKYLIVLGDRLDYEMLKPTKEQLDELAPLWDKIFEEYNMLEKNFAVTNFVSERSKILYYYAIYLQEQAVIRSLLYKTNAGYIRFLRSRGYRMANTSQTAYWQSLKDAMTAVEGHLSYIEIIKEKMKAVDGDGKKEGNPYDAIMAWIASNDIRVDDNLTVTRYIKIKEIIHQRIKAKQVEQEKSKLHG
jgi:hypothetical protein